MNLLSNQDYMWGLIIFFVLLAYVLVSILEYIRSGEHRRSGYWFSRISRGFGRRRTSWPISVMGHLFVLLSLVSGVAIVMFVSDVTIQGAAICVWAICVLFITHKKCIY